MFLIKFLIVTYQRPGNIAGANPVRITGLPFEGLGSLLLRPPCSQLGLSGLLPLELLLLEGSLVVRVRPEQLEGSPVALITTFLVLVLAIRPPGGFGWFG